VDSWFTERRTEIVAVVLISVASVMSAWCAYEAARWGSLQAVSYARASASRVESLRQSNVANRQMMIDINLFVSYANAVSTKNASFAAFISQRFPVRLKTAMRAWLATDPLKNQNAPSSPFVMKQYHLAAFDSADLLDARAQQYLDTGVRSNEISDRYILMTVLFAAVSFLAGVGSKFEGRSLVLVSLALGLLIFVGASAVVIHYPAR
jgi:hypothetical protein